MITGWILAFPVGAFAAIAMPSYVPKWAGLIVAGCLAVAVSLICQKAGMP